MNLSTKEREKIHAQINNMDEEAKFDFLDEAVMRMQEAIEDEPRTYALGRMSAVAVISDDQEDVDVSFVTNMEGALLGVAMAKYVALAAEGDTRMMMAFVEALSAYLGLDGLMDLPEEDGEDKEAA